MPAHASKVRRRLLAACLTLIASCPLAAAPAEEPPLVSTSDKQDSFYCEERRLGYWFYCTRPKPPKPVKAAATEVVTADGNPSP